MAVFKFERKQASYRVDKINTSIRFISVFDYKSVCTCSFSQFLMLWLLWALWSVLSEFQMQVLEPQKRDSFCVI